MTIQSEQRIFTGCIITKITVRDVKVFWKDKNDWADINIDMDVPDEEIYLNIYEQLWRKNVRAKN